MFKLPAGEDAADISKKIVILYFINFLIIVPSINKFQLQIHFFYLPTAPSFFFSYYFFLSSSFFFSGNFFYWIFFLSSSFFFYYAMRSLSTRRTVTSLLSNFLLKCSSHSLFFHSLKSNRMSPISSTWRLYVFYR